MNLVGPEVIEAYRVSQTYPKSPVLEQYMISNLNVPARELGALWPALLFLRDGVCSSAQPILEKS